MVTENGIAYLHGKSIRERALALIGIAHPDFREDLMREAQRLNYLRQELIHAGATKARYPSEWEVSQVLEDGAKAFFRPSKPTDERQLKEFFYSLPKDESYRRFLSIMKVFPYYDVRRMIDIDYHRELTILALAGEVDAERVIGVSRYVLDEESMTAEVDFAVHPDYGRKGVASFLIHHLAEIARKKCIRMLIAYISPGTKGFLAFFRNSAT